MIDLRQTYFFVKLIEHGSFTAAAKSLNVTVSTLSREIAALERRLERPLLFRSTRHFRASDLGAEFFRRWRETVRQIDLTQSLFEASLSDEPVGVLRISMANELASVIAPTLAQEFMKRHPKLSLEIETTPRVSQLIRDGIDLAIRVGNLEDSTYIVRRLGELVMSIYASPAYLESTQQPIRETRELSDHPCVSFSAVAKNDQWTLRSGNRTERVTVTSVMKSISFPLLENAITAGLGVGLLPRYRASHLLAEGSIREVLPAWTTVPQDLSIVMPAHAERMPKVRAFIDYLTSNRALFF